MQAAFIEPLACVVHAMKRIRVLPADPVLILGAGPMGLLLVQALRRMGASYVAVVEKQPARLELARRQWAPRSPWSSAPIRTRTLKEIAPRGFGVVVDATGVPAVIEGAFRYLRPRGTYTCNSAWRPITRAVSISPYDIFHNDWTIIGTFALCYTFLPAIDWLASGAIDVTPACERHRAADGVRRPLWPVCRRKNAQGSHADRSHSMSEASFQPLPRQMAAVVCYGPKITGCRSGPRRSLVPAKWCCASRPWASAPATSSATPAHRSSGAWATSRATASRR
jgi:hypothetical protein